jgi:hypothetical protein
MSDINLFRPSSAVLCQKISELQAITWRILPYRPQCIVQAVVFAAFRR